MANNKMKETIIKMHKSNIILILFVIFFILYLLTKAIIFAFLSGLLIFSFIIMDIYVSASQTTWKKEIIEILKAVVFALLVWYSISFILGTSVPISGVVSCSLLPSYERGDFVIVKGIKASEINAPTIEVTEKELEEIMKAKQTCGPSGNKTINYICQQMCPRISSKTKELIGYSHECVREIEIKNVKIKENLSNDVVVYAAYINGTPLNIDIVHRVFVKLKANDKYYLIMKGDNNNYLDITYLDIVKEEDIKGKVIFRIPLLGYLKLIISGPAYYAEPEGCDTILLH
ncbi:MAG: hypothetical protein NZ903_00600 [Candidatus Micrarchaeota archaeon]|nr:hypothetical protein [Candidatus Micrarchaeota archaeon]